MSLLNFAKRLERGGNDFEMIIADGVGTAAAELRRAFNRVSQKVLAEQLCELDDSLGSNVARFITTRFQILQDSGRHGNQPQLPAAAEHASATKLLT